MWSCNAHGTKRQHDVPIPFHLTENANRAPSHPAADSARAVQGPAPSASTTTLARSHVAASPPSSTATLHTWNTARTRSIQRVHRRTHTHTHTQHANAQALRTFSSSASTPRSARGPYGPPAFTRTSACASPPAARTARPNDISERMRASTAASAALTSLTAKCTSSFRCALVSGKK